jgi:uncharacterized protein YjbI with pentapeptide repeats
MTIFQIKNRFTNAVQFECELNADIAKKEYSLQLGFVVEEAVKVGANLDCANLEGANLYGANLDCANLDCANLEGANLARANLAGANLYRANLTGATLEGAKLEGAKLEGANLAGANLAGANLAGANLEGANLARANLEGANLAGVNLTDANLTGANLAGANLAGANLARANLEGAKCFNEELIYLQPIQLSGFQPWNIIIAGTHMEIGCKLHKIEDWDKLKKSRIKLMDERALDWWAEHKPLIIPIAKNHMAKHLVKANNIKG